MDAEVRCEPQVLVMQAGQSCWIDLQKGDVLHVQRGLVLVRPPLRWLADCEIGRMRRLNAGEVMVMDVRGWSLLGARSY